MPQQERGERRVSALLDAAATVLAKDGYDAATMTAIAKRARASIGALYRFFPNKLSLAQALRGRYTKEFHEHWTPLDSEAQSLSTNVLAERLISAMIHFAESYPAFLSLLEAPGSANGSPTIRRALLERMAGLFRGRCPRMTQAKALELSLVTLNIMKTAAHVSGEAVPRERKACVREFTAALSAYLESRIGPGKRRQRQPAKRAARSA